MTPTPTRHANDIHGRYTLTREDLGPRAQGVTASRVGREAPALAREGGLVTLLRTVLGHVRTDARLCFSLVGSAVGLQASADSSAASARRQLRARQALAAHCADLRPDPGAQWQWAQVRLRRRDERRSIHRHGQRKSLPMSWRLASGRRVVRGRQATPSERADDEGVVAAPSSLADTALVDRQGGENGQRSARVVGRSHRLRPSAARFSSGVYERTSWA